MQKRLVFPSFALLLFLAACDKDDEKTSALSKTEAKAEISALNATATQDLQALAASDGLKALTDLSAFANADDPFGRVGTDRNKLRTFVQKKGLQFKNILSSGMTSSRSNGAEPFDFDAHKGVYDWDAASETFIRTGPSDIISIKFPTEGSTTNNAELKLNAYSEVQVYREASEEIWYEPELIDAALLVDETEVASLHLTIEWGDDGFPLSGDITASVVPFTATVSFDVSQSTTNTLTASLTRENQTVFATSLDVLYSGPDKSEADLKLIEGFVQVRNLKLQGSINIEDMDAAEDEVDLNQYVRLQVLSNGKKVGDIVFVVEVVDGYEEQVAYIKYSDGSKEKLEDVLEPVIEELDQISEDLNG